MRRRTNQPGVRGKLGKLWCFATKRRTIVIGGLVLGIFILANAAVFFLYKDKTYPRTFVAKLHIGSLNEQAFKTKLASLQVVRPTIEVSYQKQKLNIKTADLGISVDAQKITSNAHAGRTWVPLYDLFARHDVPASVSLDQKAFNTYLQVIEHTFEKDAVDARLAMEADLFVIKPSIIGLELDHNAFTRRLTMALEAGDTTISLPIILHTPSPTAAAMQTEWQQLIKQQHTPFVFKYAGKTKQFTPQEISVWFTPKGKSYDINDNNIQASIARLAAASGLQVTNLNEAVHAAHQALQTTTALDFALQTVVKPAKTYSYCTAVRGVDAGNLAALKSKLANTYIDARGWSLTGQVVFTPVSSGCNFTVWLSAASEMPGFGSICDAEWSCQVGANVVINFDRWQGASAAWNAAHGSLDDYRSMVINHETGHWLGFYHAACGGPGQLAPVMQQQSIDLQGCVFNPWPLASELATLKTRLGI